MTTRTLEEIHASLDDGLVIPYLGPGVLSFAGEGCPLPASPEALVGRLTVQASVPHKIRNNLTAAAQFIENFKHRKTVSKAMTDAFAAAVPPTALHRYLAAVPALPLLVHAWYDDLPQRALAGRHDWGMQYFRADGSRVTVALLQIGHEGRVATCEVPAEAAAWSTLLYQPFGSVRPAANYLVSDTDFVEVLTEIDIQTPIPEPVQHIRTGRHFLFLGCRFAAQLDRLFARQIMKRSSDRHWAVLPQEPTRNEARFLKQQNIERFDMPLDEFIEALTRAGGGDDTVGLPVSRNAPADNRDQHAILGA
jgi:SIR2-like domain